MNHHTHLIYGNQQLQINEYIQTVKSQLLAGQSEEYAEERFDVQEILKNVNGIDSEDSAESLRITCETIPFLSNIKIIQIDHVELLKSDSSPGAFLNEKSIQHSLINYIKKTPSYLWLLLTASVTKERDINKQLINAIKTKGKIVKFVTYDDFSPVNWLMNRINQNKLNIDRSGAELLVEIAGNNLSLLDLELKKLKLLNAKEERITPEILIKCISAHETNSVFRLTEALSKKKLITSIESLNQLLKGSTGDEIRIFSLIVQQFRRMLKIHYLKEENGNDGSIVSKLGMHPFLAKQVLKQAGNFSKTELENIMLLLANLDIPLKFNKSNAKIILQDLFVKICANPVTL